MLLKNYKKIENSKNLVFYPRKKNDLLEVSFKLLKSIKIFAKQNRRNVFLCLHNSPNEKFHNMIIFLWKGTYYSPHKHKKKEEIINIIEGKKRINIHNLNGKLLRKITLDAKNNPIIRINKNKFHSVEVLSKYVIYHEIKPGPFNLKNK
jgi:cupin fold WbuC family metalloprotein